VPLDRLKGKCAMTYIPTGLISSRGCAVGTSRLGFGAKPQNWVKGLIPCQGQGADCPCPRRAYKYTLLSFVT